jgi:hypothetical protein
MMNFKVGLLITYLKLLESQAGSLRLPPPQDPMDPANALFNVALPAFPSRLTADLTEHIKLLLDGVGNVSTILKSTTIPQLLKEAGWTLEYGGTREEMAAHLESIRKILEIEFRSEWFYHYPKEKLARVHAIDSEWGNVVSAFPSAKYDIAHGLDSYACDHNTAAVFHMMRVAEIGLIRLAKELGVRLKKDKPLSHAQWGEIVGEIQRVSDGYLHSVPAGHGKDEALSFYNGAASHVRALKDKYRNVVMHSRREFNEHEAGDAMFHTRSFMNGLSERLSEGNSKRIKWKF